jgi:transposase
MRYYGGIDLHSNNSYVVVIDETGTSVFRRRLANDLSAIERVFSNFGEALVGIAVESTYNWYWLVDGLMAAGHRVHLANPAAIKMYEGIKHTDDPWDAHWLADMLRLGILPEGYIYPAAERTVRDLLRRRTNLVQQNTRNLLSIQTLAARSSGLQISGNAIKQLRPDDLATVFADPDVIQMAAAHLRVMGCLGGEIATIERSVVSRARLKPEFAGLKTIPGVGKVLALVIMYETGEIGRFASPGNYASYCRCVGSERLSNGKKKGVGNRKSGNAHLAWAFVEAAHFARRYDERAQRFYQRKRAKTGVASARKAVAHKLARASFYIMRDRVPFDSGRCFG